MDIFTISYTKGVSYQGFMTAYNNFKTLKTTQLGIYIFLMYTYDIIMTDVMYIVSGS